MSWKITQDGSAIVVVLEGEIGIQDAANFHQAVLPLASSDGPVRLDTSASKSIHTSIMQILYSLSQAATEFVVTEESEDFRAVEARLGLFLASTKQGRSSTHQSRTSMEVL